MTDLFIEILQMTDLNLCSLDRYYFTNHSNDGFPRSNLSNDGFEGHKYIIYNIIINIIS